MGQQTLKIKMRGEEDFQNVSLRLSKNMVELIDEASYRINCSRNKLICIMLKYALDNLEIVAEE